MTRLNSKPLNGKFILIAGSANPACPEKKLEVARRVVNVLTTLILEGGGGVVVFASNEPIADAPPNLPLIFDWIILREIDRHIGMSQSAARCVRIVSSQKAFDRMTDAQRQILSRLSQRGAAEVMYVDNEVHTGGNISDEQVRFADAMIAIGGGKGVMDRARKMILRGCPVLPLDLNIGAIVQDGDGALALHRQLLSVPERFFPKTYGNVRNRLASLSLEFEGADPTTVAEQAVQLVGEEIAARGADSPIAVVLLTALPVELAAAHAALHTGDTMPTTLPSGTLYWSTELDGIHSARPKRIAVTCIATPGNIDAASATTEILVTIKPRIVLMVGIAAGMRGKCQLGEVVISDRVISYEPAAATVSDGQSIEVQRPESYRIAHSVQQDIAAYIGDEEKRGARLGASDISTRVPGTNESISVRTATIASGEKLLRDPAKFKSIRNLHGKIEVCEMEAAGVAAACHRAGVDFLIVRGISDFGDEEKNDSFHAIAARRAALIAVDFLRFGLHVF